MPNSLERLAAAKKAWEEGQAALVFKANSFLKARRAHSRVKGRSKIVSDNELSVLLCNCYEELIESLRAIRPKPANYPPIVSGRNRQPVKLPRNTRPWMLGEAVLNDYHDETDLALEIAWILKCWTEAKKRRELSNWNRCVVDPMRLNAARWRRWFSEQKQRLQSEPPQDETGVTIFDLAYLIENDETVAKQRVKEWIDNKKITAKPIGKCPLDGRRQLYRLSEIISDLKKILVLSSGEIREYRKRLLEKLRAPKSN